MINKLKENKNIIALIIALIVLLVILSESFKKTNDNINKISTEITTNINDIELKNNALLLNGAKEIVESSTEQIKNEFINTNEKIDSLKSSQKTKSENNLKRKIAKYRAKVEDGIEIKPDMTPSEIHQLCNPKELKIKPIEDNSFLPIPLTPKRVLDMSEALEKATYPIGLGMGQNEIVKAEIEGNSSKIEELQSDLDFQRKGLDTINNRTANVEIDCMLLKKKVELNKYSIENNKNVIEKNVSKISDLEKSINEMSEKINKHIDESEDDSEDETE